MHLKNKSPYSVFSASLVHKALRSEPGDGGLFESADLDPPRPRDERLNPSPGSAFKRASWGNTRVREKIQMDQSQRHLNNVDFISEDRCASKGHQNSDELFSVLLWSPFGQTNTVWLVARWAHVATSNGVQARCRVLIFRKQHNTLRKKIVPGGGAANMFLPTCG